jgi:hypothetical protein
VLIRERRLLERGAYWRGELIGVRCLLEMGAYWRWVLIRDEHLLERGLIRGSTYWRGGLLERGAYLGGLFGWGG